MQPAPDPQPTSARLARVQTLYEEVIDKVVEGLRDEMMLEGLDESALEELKTVCPTLRNTLLAATSTA